MLDHIGLVTDLARSKGFFERALAPLGYTKLMEFSGAVGFGMAVNPISGSPKGSHLNPCT
jgi:hypothetical protein